MTFSSFVILLLLPAPNEEVEDEDEDEEEDVDEDGSCGGWAGGPAIPACSDAVMREAMYASLAWRLGAMAAGWVMLTRAMRR